MKSPRVFLTSLFLIVMLMPLTGCGVSSVAKQAYYEFRGAQSEIMLISPFEDHTLKPYRNLRIEPATSTVGPQICPPKLLHYYDKFAANLIEDLREVYPGEAPTLRINSEILYFQSKGLLSGAMCLTRVKMRDIDDERLVVDALVLTESKSFREGGRSDLAESNVKALRKFLREQDAPKNSMLDEL